MYLQCFGRKAVRLCFCLLCLSDEVELLWFCMGYQGGARESEQGVKGWQSLKKSLLNFTHRKMPKQCRSTDREWQTLRKPIPMRMPLTVGTASSVVWFRHNLFKNQLQRNWGSTRKDTWFVLPKRILLVFLLVVFWISNELCASCGTSQTDVMSVVSAWSHFWGDFLFLFIYFILDVWIKSLKKKRTRIWKTKECHAKCQYQFSL